MRKFSFEVLNEQEFRAFAEASPQSNFQQTVEMANLRRMHGMDVDFVGMREDGEIKAGAVFATHHAPMATFCSVISGPLCDYDDDELVAETSNRQDTSTADSCAATRRPCAGGSPRT